MYTRGITGLNHILWIENWAVPLCIKALSSNRSNKILRFLRFDTKLDVVVVGYPTPSKEMGAGRKNMEPQKPGNSPGSGPEVVERQRVAKE